jgi:hypothetical protein
MQPLPEYQPVPNGSKWRPQRAENNFFKKLKQTT